MREKFFMKPVSFTMVFIFLVMSSGINVFAYPAGNILIALGRNVSKNGGNKVTIINICDAHDALSAQRSIGKSINKILDKYGNIPVCVEGLYDEFKLPKKYIDFPVKNIRDMAAVEYIKKGIFTGSEYGIVSGGKRYTLCGVEDKALFIENYRAYKRIVRNKNKINTVISKLEACLEDGKGAYSKKLVKLLSNFTSYSDGKMPLIDYMSLLFSFSYSKENLYNYPNIALLLESSDLLRKIDEKRLLNEVNSLKDNFIAVFAEYEDGRINYDEFIKKLSVSGKPNIKLYSKYVSKLRLLSPNDLLTEIEEITFSLANDIATEEEKKFVMLSKFVFYFKRVFTLNATRSEVALFFQEYGSFLQNDFLRKEISNSFDFKRLFSIYGDIKEFYSCAEKRDKIFVKNVGRYLKKYGGNTAILVSGGYHSEGIRRECEARGYNCVFVYPLISDSSLKAAYENRLSGKLFSLKPEFSCLQDKFEALFGAIADEPGLKKRLLDDFIELEEVFSVPNRAAAIGLFLSWANSDDPEKRGIARAVYESSEPNKLLLRGKKNLYLFFNRLFDLLKQRELPPLSNENNDKYAIELVYRGDKYVDYEHFVHCQKILKGMSDDEAAYLYVKLGLNASGENFKNKTENKVKVLPLFSKTNLYESILSSGGYTKRIVDIVSGNSFKKPRVEKEISYQSSEPKLQSVCEAVSNSLDSFTERESSIGQFGKGIKQLLEWLSAGSKSSLDIYTRKDNCVPYKISFVKDSYGKNYISIREITDNLFEKVTGLNNSGTFVEINYEDSEENPSPLEIADRVKMRFLCSDSASIRIEFENGAVESVNGYDSKEFLIGAPMDAIPVENNIDLFLGGHRIVVRDNGSGMNAVEVTRMFVPKQGAKRKDSLDNNEVIKELNKIRLIGDKSSRRSLIFARNGEVIDVVDIKDNIVSDAIYEGGIIIDGGLLFDVPESRDKIIIPLRVSKENESNFEKVIMEVVDKVLTCNIGNLKKIKIINTVVAGLDSIVGGNEEYAYVVGRIKNRIKGRMAPFLRDNFNDNIFLPFYNEYEKLDVVGGVLWLHPDIFNWYGIENLLAMGGIVAPGVTLGGEKELPLIGVKFKDKYLRKLNLFDKSWYKKRKELFPIIKTDKFVVMPANLIKDFCKLLEKKRNARLDSNDEETFYNYLNLIEIVTADKVNTNYELGKKVVNVQFDNSGRLGSDEVLFNDDKLAGDFLKGAGLIFERRKNYICYLDSEGNINLKDTGILFKDKYGKLICMENNFYIAEKDDGSGMVFKIEKNKVVYKYNLYGMPYEFYAYTDWKYAVVVDYSGEIKKYGLLDCENNELLPLADLRIEDSFNAKFNINDNSINFFKRFDGKYYVEGIVSLDSKKNREVFIEPELYAYNKVFGKNYILFYDDNHSPKYLININTGKNLLRQFDSDDIKNIHIFTTGDICSIVLKNGEMHVFSFVLNSWLWVNRSLRGIEVVRYGDGKYLYHALMNDYTDIFIHPNGSFYGDYYPDDVYMSESVISEYDKCYFMDSNWKLLYSYPLDNYERLPYIEKYDLLIKHESDGCYLCSPKSGKKVKLGEDKNNVVLYASDKAVVYVDDDSIVAKVYDGESDENVRRFNSYGVKYNFYRYYDGEFYFVDGNGKEYGVNFNPAGLSFLKNFDSELENDEIDMKGWLNSIESHPILRILAISPVIKKYFVSPRNNVILMETSDGKNGYCFLNLHNASNIGYYDICDIPLYADMFVKISGKFSSVRFFGRDNVPIDIKSSMLRISSDYKEKIYIWVIGKGGKNSLFIYDLKEKNIFHWGESNDDIGLPRYWTDYSDGKKRLYDLEKRAYVTDKFLVNKVNHKVSANLANIRWNLYGDFLLEYSVRDGNVVEAVLTNMKSDAEPFFFKVSNVEKDRYGFLSNKVFYFYNSQKSLFYVVTSSGKYTYDIRGRKFRRAVYFSSGNKYIVVNSGDDAYMITFDGQVFNIRDYLPPGYKIVAPSDDDAFILDSVRKAKKLKFLPYKFVDFMDKRFKNNSENNSILRLWEDVFLAKFSFLLQEKKIESGLRDFFIGEMNDFIRFFRSVSPCGNDGLYYAFDESIREVYFKENERLMSLFNENVDKSVGEVRGLLLNAVNESFVYRLKRIKQYGSLIKKLFEKELLELKPEKPHLRNEILRNIIREIVLFGASAENIDEKSLKLVFFLASCGWRFQERDYENLDVISKFFQILRESNYQSYREDLYKIAVVLSNISDHYVLIRQMNRVVSKNHSVCRNILENMQLKFRKISLKDVETYIEREDINILPLSVRVFFDFFSVDAEPVREAKRGYPNIKERILFDDGIYISQLIKIYEIWEDNSVSLMNMKDMVNILKKGNFPSPDYDIETEIIKNVTVQREGGAYCAEVAQNSMDANIDNEKGELLIDYYVEFGTDGEPLYYVEEMSDNGPGALNELALVLPESLKAGDFQKNMAGFFGTGKYTVFNQCDMVEIISKNNSGGYMFKFAIDRDKDGNLKSVKLLEIDVLSDDSRWPVGVTLRRIKRVDSTIPELEKSISEVNWKIYAGMSSMGKFKIFFNNVDNAGKKLLNIDKELSSVVDFIVPSAGGDGHNVDFGEVKIWQTSDMPSQILDKKGLRVCDLGEKYTVLIPAHLRPFLSKLGINIQIPLPLIRGRSSFVNETYYLPYIRKYIAIAFYRALAYKTLKDVSPQFVFSGLPMDWETSVMYDYAINDRKIMELAYKINSGDLNDISVDDLSYLISNADKMEEIAVQLVLLLEVYLDPMNKSDKSSMLLRRYAILGENSQNEQMEYIMKLGGYKSMALLPDNEKIPFYEKKVNLFSNRSNLTEQMLTPEDFIVPYEDMTDKEKKFISMAKEEASFIGIEQVYLIGEYRGDDAGRKGEYVLCRGCYMPYRGKPALFLDRKLAGEKNWIEIVQHEKAHFLEAMINLNKNATALISEGYVAHASDFTHQQVGTFAEAMKYSSWTSLYRRVMNDTIIKKYGSIAELTNDIMKLNGVDDKMLSKIDLYTGNSKKDREDSIMSVIKRAQDNAVKINIGIGHSLMNSDLFKTYLNKLFDVDIEGLKFEIAAYDEGKSCEYDLVLAFSDEIDEIPYNLEGKVIFFDRGNEISFIAETFLLSGVLWNIVNAVTEYGKEWKISKECLGKIFSGFESFEGGFKFAFSDKMAKAVIMYNRQNYVKTAA